MGRKPRNLTIQNLTERLLKEIDSEHDPARLVDLLVAYIKANEILEEQERKKEETKQKKLAMP